MICKRYSIRNSTSNYKTNVTNALRFNRLLQGVAFGRHKPQDPIAELNQLVLLRLKETKEEVVA